MVARADRGLIAPAAPPRAGRRLLDAALAVRDQWLASPVFQRQAARFPLTRWIARRRARQVFDLVAGFVYSQVLLACVRLRLFELLATRPQTLTEVARAAGLEATAAERLLAAAVSLRLVERRSGGRYGLGALGAPLAGNAGLCAMVEHHTALYADLADPVALLRGEISSPANARYWPYAAGRAEPGPQDAARIAAYSELMSASQTLVAAQVIDAYPFARHRRVLDVGGGEGSFLLAVARAAPQLELRLFDLPPVAARAASRLAAAGLGARAEAAGGSFLCDPLPRGADLVTLVRVLHDHDDASVRTLLSAVHAALPPGGRVVIAEPLAGTPGAEPMGDAYFGLYLLAMGGGRPRSAARLFQLLGEAGFTGSRQVPTALPLQCSLLVAAKPSA